MRGFQPFPATNQIASAKEDKKLVKTSTSHDQNMLSCKAAKHSKACGPVVLLALSACAALAIGFHAAECRRLPPAPSPLQPVKSGQQQQGRKSLCQPFRKPVDALEQFFKTIQRNF
eukprot:scaffold223612_cov15-Tisochrysis_lutea.AAC.1